MKSREYWNKFFNTISLVSPPKDNWLEKYLYLFNSKDRIVDLGCGDGADTFYLCHKGFNTIACDFSETALKKVETLCYDNKVLCFDMRKRLPFDDNSIDIVISDLSLHYFRWKTTVKIVKELERIIKPNGLLIGRVNSVKDINYGAMKGRKLENNYYYINDYSKRFFDNNDISELFYNWEILSLKEQKTDKYGEIKILWEFCIKRTA